MKVHTVIVFAALISGAAGELRGQTTRITLSGGEVVEPARKDASRLATRIPGVEPELRGRVMVGGDSAQRIAIADFDWRGRVISVEFDHENDRLFWDVKIVPDSTRQTIVRYRVDAASGGILGIREFTGIRGLHPR